MCVKMQNKKLGSLVAFLLFVGIFIVMFTWFTNIHPLIVFDADDWTYIGSVRRALPLWGEWNPARILPEILMPLCGSIASYIVYPITGDYLFSMTLVSSAIVSSFILLYAITFYGMIKKRGGVEQVTACWLTLLFLAMHFLVFRGTLENNMYMFYCSNLTCYFYYLIPALLNASIVFYLEWNRKMNNAVFVVAVYLAIFSNLVTSIILASYAGCVIVYDYIFGTTKKNIVSFSRKHKRDILIIVLWCVSAVYELSGGRASSFTTYTSYINSVFASIKGILITVYNSNRSFIAVAVIAILTAGFVMIKSQKEGVKSNINRERFLFSLAMVVNLIYTILLCAKLGYRKSYLSTYLFAFVMFGFLIIIFSIACVIEKYKNIAIAVPLCTLILLFEINTAGHTFQESNMIGVSNEEALSISNAILAQVLAADEKQASEMTLFVPKYDDSEDNWPQAIYLGDRLANTLYEHGLIDRKIQITVVPCDLEDAQVKYRNRMEKL